MRCSSRRLKRARPLLGTYVEIELRGDADEALLSRWITEGFQAVAEVDRLMSYHRPDSDLTRLNRARPGAWVAVHPLTSEVLRASNALFRASRGVFDIRCGMVLARRGILPFPSGRRPPLPLVGAMVPLEIHGRRARKTGPWVLDLGGIAKGYAVDRAVHSIRRAASGRHVCGTVNAGGDLRAWGKEAAPAAVRIHGLGGPIKPFLIRDSAAATSMTRDGRGPSGDLAPAAHIRMPQGIPLAGSRSVTVLADRCLWADALTKVALLAPPELARACLAAYQAKALIFGPGGGLTGVLQ